MSISTCSYHLAKQALYSWDKGLFYGQRAILYIIKELFERQTIHEWIIYHTFPIFYKYEESTLYQPKIPTDYKLNISNRIYLHICNVLFIYIYCVLWLLVVERTKIYGPTYVYVKQPIVYIQFIYKYPYFMLLSITVCDPKQSNISVIEYAFVQELDEHHFARVNCWWFAYECMKNCVICHACK